MEDNNFNKDAMLGTEVEQPDALKSLTAEQRERIEEAVSDKVFGKGQMPVIGEISAEEADEKIGGDPNSAILVQNMEPAGDGVMKCEVVTKPATQEHVRLANGQEVPIPMNAKQRKQLKRDIERDIKKGRPMGRSAQIRSKDAAHSNTTKPHAKKPAAKRRAQKKSRKH